MEKIHCSKEVKLGSSIPVQKKNTLRVLFRADLQEHQIDLMISNSFTIMANSGVLLSSKDGVLLLGKSTVKYCHHYRYVFLVGFF